MPSNLPTFVSNSEIPTKMIWFAHCFHGSELFSRLLVKAKSSAMICHHFTFPHQTSFKKTSQMIFKSFFLGPFFDAMPSFIPSLPNFRSVRLPRRWTDWTPPFRWTASAASRWPTCAASPASWRRRRSGGWRRNSYGRSLDRGGKKTKQKQKGRLIKKGGKKWNLGHMKRRTTNKKKAIQWPPTKGGGCQIVTVQF